MLECSWDIICQYKPLINQILVGKKNIEDLNKRVSLQLNKLNFSEPAKLEIMGGVLEILSNLRQIVADKEQAPTQTKHAFLNEAWGDLEQKFIFNCG